MVVGICVVVLRIALRVGTGMECQKLGLVSGLLLVELLGFQQALSLQLSCVARYLPS